MPIQKARILLILIYSVNECQFGDPIFPPNHLAGLLFVFVFVSVPTSYLASVAFVLLYQDLHFTATFHSIHFSFFVDKNFVNIIFYKNSSNLFVLLMT